MKPKPCFRLLTDSRIIKRLAWILASRLSSLESICLGNRVLWPSQGRCWKDFRLLWIISDSSWTQYGKVNLNAFLVSILLFSQTRTFQLCRLYSTYDNGIHQRKDYWDLVG
ncbi:hypothetical protein AVEN_21320-1 [Araneus ventricosus]|uniref:Uncharacterized protein n=1 Tax=Araneus ventricosus TaxID=182803 RepID=A0A4Y2F2K6_ARAVE|nr:hypothetical protein AVEN_21320-1 [Araneus ventricosus]